MNRLSLALVAWMGTLLMLPVQAVCISISASRVSAQHLVSQLPQEQLKQLAESITVKISSGNNGGSGILIRKEGQIYTVLSNQHVLESGKPPLIRTPDRKTHQADLVREVNFAGNDLALMQFRAKGNYAVGSLGNSSNLKDGEEVFAAGFPFEAYWSESGEFVFRTGRISLLLQKALVGGYGIGYTNEIEKGMSGGPVLNREGKVIGINGIHAQPLWGDPYVYQDGTRPNDTLRQRMRRSSWAVPIDIFATLAPAFAPAGTQPAAVETKPPTPSIPQVANQVDKIAKEITVLITWPSSNGSGVIIAKEGNTYYILTAKHLVRGKSDLKVVTPDGQEYPVNNSTVKTWSGVDLALLQFTSNQTYQVATLANYSTKEDRVVFVSGWPESRQATAKPSHQFTTGFLFGLGIEQAKDSRSFSSGYEMVYTNITTKGMSGSPVLDTGGRLIGIHAAAEGDSIPSKEATGIKRELHLGYSLGIPIRTFLALVQQEKMGLKLREESSLPPRLSAPEQDAIVKSSLNSEAPGNKADEIDWLNYGNKLLRSLEAKAAQAAFDTAIKIKPDFYEGWYARGLSLMRQEKYQEAVESFKKATEYNSDSDGPWRQLGDAFYYLKQYDQARLAFNKAIEIKPDDFILYVFQGAVLRAAGSYSEAIKFCDRALEINPYPVVYTLRGSIRYNMGDYQGAIADFNEAVRLQPDYADAYGERGFVHFSLEDYQEAIADFNEALRFQPDYADAYAGRGVVRAKMGNLQGFIDDFNEALRLNPDNANIYKLRGLARYLIKDYQGALNDLSEAIRLAPELAYQYYNERGNVRYKQGNYQGAVSDYTEALRLKPNDAVIYSNRADARDKQGDYQGAVSDYNEALRLKPDYADTYNSRYYPLSPGRL